MPFSTFKDLDSATADMIADDFDIKYTLKIKSPAPASTTITTNIQYVDKDGKASFKPKIALKWPHASGFTLEKLELSPDCKMTVETSLSNTLPGLKLEFKGNDADKADLSFKYVLPAATLTGEVDINNLSKAEASVCAGHGDFTGGLSATVTTAKDDKASIKVAVGAAIGHNLPNVCSASLRAKENFSAFTMMFAYTQLQDIDVAGVVNYSAKATSATLLGAYQLDKTTKLKAKINTDGVLAASLKKSFEKKFSVVGSVEVPSDLKCIKFGLNATLG
jgi:hypothetical protein